MHSLGLSNKKGNQLIKAGEVEIEGATINANCLLDPRAEIKVQGKVVRKALSLLYLKFYKPVGFESSLNTTVPNNLSEFFKDYEGLAIAGRLDKASEGLILLSNDGHWVEEICNPKFEKTKEYLVTLDKNPSQQFLEHFRSGVQIGPYKTKPCSCEHTDGATIQVTLMEGKNRQIRRMCHNLGYGVVTLKRTRIADFYLNDLSPGGMVLEKPLPQNKSGK